MLKIEHLTKKYDQFKAVDDLSLHIERGHIYGFIGHNGAGKTTTLKAVAGIMPFDEGEIIIDGKSMKTHALECKKIMAYIPDNPDLYEYLTGIQYLNFIADVYQVCHLLLIILLKWTNYSDIPNQPILFLTF